MLLLSNSNLSYEEAIYKYYNKIRADKNYKVLDGEKSIRWWYISNYLDWTQQVVKNYEQHIADYQEIYIQNRWLIKHPVGALRWYIAEGYRQINSVLRGYNNFYTTDKTEVKKMIRLLDEVVDVASPHNIILFRHISAGSLNFNIRKNEVIQDNGFCSTTLDINYIMSLINKENRETQEVVMMIKLDRGQKGVYLGALQHIPLNPLDIREFRYRAQITNGYYREAEILLPRGLSLKIEKVLFNKENKSIIEVKVIDH